MKRDSFIFYRDWHEIIRDLPNDIKLEIYEGITNYVFFSQSSQFSPMASLAFSFIQKTIDRDSEKYNRIKELRSNAGKRGGAPIGNNNAKTSKNKQNKQLPLYVNVNDNVNDNVNVNENVNDNVNEKENENVNVDNTSPRPCLNPPSLKEFIDYALQVNPAIDISEGSELVNRYNTWKSAKWLDSEGKSIIEYWQRKLKTAIPYLTKDAPKKSNIIDGSKYKRLA